MADSKIKLGEGGRSSDQRRGGWQILRLKKGKMADLEVKRGEDGRY